MKKFVILFLTLTSGVFSNTSPSDSLCLDLNRLYNNCNMVGDNYPFDADGSLILSQLKFRVTGFNEFSLFSANCSFYATTGDTTSRENVGDVTINDTIGVVFWTDSTYKIFGMNLSQDTSFTWKIDNTVNGIISPVSSYTTTKPLIHTNNFNLANVDTVVSRGMGFAYSHSPIQADSIIYIFASDSDRVQKKVIGFSSGISFSASELLTLPISDTGGFFILVYNVMPAYLNGKKYYFQNNSTAIVTGIHVQ